MIGGNEKDNCYSNVEKSGAIFFKRGMNQDLLNNYYSASDILKDMAPQVSPEFRGLGISVLEALFFGLPVVSRSLDYVKDINTDNLGIAPKTQIDALML